MKNKWNNLDKAYKKLHSEYIIHTVLLFLSFSFLSNRSVFFYNVPKKPNYSSKIKSDFILEVTGAIWLLEASNYLFSFNLILFIW